MTVPRLILLVLAVLALADGAVWEAVGIVGVIAALALWDHWMGPPRGRTRLRGVRL